jgi:two-component system sensor histidine kinase CpxA
VDRHDELGDLAHSVNTMAIQLESHVCGRKRFLDDVAHELCAPVSRMQAALGILEHHSNDASSSHYLSTLRQELDELGCLVDELLQFSKTGTQRAVSLRPVFLAPVVAGVVAREAAGVPVTCDVPEDLAVHAEPTLLSRALGSVLRNAVRYAGGAGPITVSAAPQQGGIALIVADSGSGVPAESLPRLFDAFYRPDSARARETGGAGLGLAVVKTCVEACGGRVAARNRGRTGFEVIFALPAAGIV